MPGRKDLSFRSGYFGDPAASRALAGLLQDVFGIDVTIMDRLGGPDPTGIPFSWFDADGACIANISTFSLPLVVDGVSLRAAGLQSGAVRPGHRGMGLYRDVMEAALAHCDAEGFAAVALLTDTPALYGRYGFEPLVQHRFAGAASGGGTTGPVRRLDLGSAADIALLRRLLDGRQPVSDRFAPVRQTGMFLFNAALMPDVRLDLIGDDAVVAWRMAGDGAFDLLDVAGTRIPRLADILASVQAAAAQVVVHFPPDRLEWQGEALADTGEMVLMLRMAKTLRPEGPFALSPMAEF
ncbi:GNAT family N-acetyltransferase [Shinella zoogloeoides]